MGGSGGMGAHTRRAAVFALVAVVIAVVGQSHADGECVAGSPEAGTAACAAPTRDSVLLQTNREKLTAHLSVPTAMDVQSDDIVFLRVSRTGNVITCEKNGFVHAHWNHEGSWQELKVVREAGAGAVQSGDVIFIWNNWNKTLAVQGTKVHGKWANTLSWEKFIITTKAGGPIMSGSKVFLEAHTGKIVDADPPDSPGSVQARFTNKLTWEELIIEKRDVPTTEEPTTSAPTTEAPTPKPTTGEPTTPRPTTTIGACVQKGSLGKCEPCLKSEQCGGGRYCCPYMKKCVMDQREACSYPIAQCYPMCYDSRNNAECTCANEKFPGEWQNPTCSGSPPAPATTTAAPAPATTEAPPAPATTTAAPAPATTEAPEPETEQPSAGAWENFMLVNELRKSGFTCPGGSVYPPNDVPLKFDCKLWKACQLHSQDMADNGYFSHTSQDGRSPWDRAAEQGTKANGENIAAGRGSASRVLEQWKNSDGHCKNMLNPSYEVLSVGYGYNADSRYRHYWTQMFRRTAGEVDTSCYPTMSLAQARGEDFGRHEGQEVPIEASTAGEGQDEAVGSPWHD